MIESIKILAMLWEIQTRVLILQILNWVDGYLVNVREVSVVAQDKHQF